MGVFCRCAWARVGYTHDPGMALLALCMRPASVCPAAVPVCRAADLPNNDEMEVLPQPTNVDVKMTVVDVKMGWV